MPLNRGTLNGQVEKLNKECVVISDTEWKLYDEKGITSINLIFKNVDGVDISYFSYKRLK